VQNRRLGPGKIIKNLLKNLYGIWYDMEELKIMNLLHTLEDFTTDEVKIVAEAE